MTTDGNPPRMADVARAAGVSTMTVSRAFRSDGSVSDKRRDEILKIAEAMGYVFDRGASEMRTKKTGFVAVCVPSINNPNFADTVRGLTDAVAEHDLEVLLGYTNYQVEREEQMIRQLLRRKPEAIIVTGSAHTEAARDMLVKARVPVIETWDEPADPVGYSVGFSNAVAGEMMADHFIARGYRRIAFIGGATGNDTRGVARRRGFVGRLEAAGRGPVHEITLGKPPAEARHGAEGARLLLETFPETEAVMCVSDAAAFGAMSEFQRLGLSVPGDIAVAGFGAFDVSAFAIPAMTTIDPNAREIGRAAGDLIRTLLRDKPAMAGTRHVPVEPALVVRQST